MDWKPPKTDWETGNAPLPGDFNRIEGNTQEIKNKSDNLQIQVDELKKPYTWGKLKGV